MKSPKILLQWAKKTILLNRFVLKRKNIYLIDRINNLTNAKITIPERKIVEYKEALIFAFLGVLRYLNIDNCYSSVTGAKKDHCSGNIFNP